MKVITLQPVITNGYMPQESASPRSNYVNWKNRNHTKSNKKKKRRRKNRQNISSLGLTEGISFLLSNETVKFKREMELRKRPGNKDGTSDVEQTSLSYVCSIQPASCTFTGI